MPPCLSPFAKSAMHAINLTNTDILPFPYLHIVPPLTGREGHTM